jgi:hypothetical protein
MPEQLSIQHHRQSAQTLLQLRQALALMTTRIFNLRVPAPVLDAALRVEHALANLCMRLQDQSGVADLSAIDPPLVARAQCARARRMSVDEHHAVGAELYQIRDRMQTLAIVLQQHFPKSSSVGKALHRPERAIDHLRCRLDDLFCTQHPEQFSTRVYYPGHAAIGGER